MFRPGREQTLLGKVEGCLCVSQEELFCELFLGNLLFGGQVYPNVDAHVAQVFTEQSDDFSFDS